VSVLGFFEFFFEFFLNFLFIYFFDFFLNCHVSNGHRVTWQ